MICSLLTDGQTDGRTDTKVNTEDILSGFQEFSLQPIIKDRSKMQTIHSHMFSSLNDDRQNTMLRHSLRRQIGCRINSNETLKCVKSCLELHESVLISHQGPSRPGTSVKTSEVVGELGGTCVSREVRMAYFETVFRLLLRRQNLHIFFTLTTGFP